MTESATSDAITALKEGFYSTPTAAAKAYNVAPRTVQRRLQGMGSRSSRTPLNRALNPEQEQAIRNYLKRLDNAGISATLSMLRGAANYLLTGSNPDACTPLPTISPCWLRRFLNGNKQLFKKKQKPLAIDQNAHNVEDFMVYFEDELKSRQKKRKKRRLTLEKGLQKLCLKKLRHIKRLGHSWQNHLLELVENHDFAVAYQVTNSTTPSTRVHT